MLNEIKRLHAKGFSVILIQPKSKKPKEMGWTRGPRKTLPELIASYRLGDNIGVRLGDTSIIDGQYLSAIDCDVKSKDPKHLKEMEAELAKLDIPAGPVVASGRGQGSRHIYIRTKVPLATKIWAKSEDIVKIKMPSAPSLSKREKDELTEDEQKQGIRLRRAWEISVMSTGHQTVLPPSIHCDTGKPYTWANASSQWEIPTLDHTIFGESSGPKPFNEYQKELYGTFEREDVDLVGSQLPQTTVDMILEGKGCKGDKSASALGVCISMLKAGYTDNQICSVLTDKAHYFGEMAFRHTQSGSLARAAHWIKRAIIKKAKQLVEEDLGVLEVEIPDVILPPEEAKAQEIDIKSSIDWRSTLETFKDGRPKVTLLNIHAILTNALAKKTFVKNEFLNREIYGEDTLWGEKKNTELKDVSLLRIRKWLANNYRIEPTSPQVLDAIKLIASENGFHPVRDYLNSLEWDGIPRINTWLKTYVSGEAPEPYLTDISRKTLCAMVARVFVPGIKFDHMLILEGKQGIGKSSVCRILAGDAWFSDTTIDINSKDGILNLQGSWIVEISELVSIKKVESETYKSFFSRSTDRVRSPYDRISEDHPRQSIFIGSTNEGGYLKDKTGNRRFWPVKIGECRLKALKKDRDQLLAEAKWVWDNCREELYLDNEVSRDQASNFQGQRVADDDETMMLDCFQRFEESEAQKPITERFNFSKFRMMVLFDIGGPFHDWAHWNRKYQAGSNVLHRAGYKKLMNKQNLWSKS